MTSLTIKALREAGGDPSGWPIPNWTAEEDKAFMNQEQISFAFLSITAPGPAIVKDSDAQQFARKTNLYAASLRDAHPSRYGFFAALPSLLNKEVAKEEIIYALDTLKADGVTLFTRYGKDNHYLGHADFQEIWDLLDSREATVFIHPTHAVDTNLVNPHLPQPMIDYPHETTRTAVDLLMSNTVRNHPKCKIILSHAGGTLPYLAHRPAIMLPFLGQKKLPKEFLEDARQFYFDIALSSTPQTLDLLTKFAKPGHILFGSDYPYAPEPAIKQLNRDFDTYCDTHPMFADSVNRSAALALFPRLKITPKL
jgi:predicted TIM-barrel fold metal-dependent hydrolase